MVNVSSNHLQYDCLFIFKNIYTFYLLELLAVESNKSENTYLNK